MRDSKANIFPLGHSSFLVETKNNILIFDYYEDSLNLEKINVEDSILSNSIFKTDKSIFVFVSHSHSDHYTPDIFDWKKENPNIEYILSSDLREIIDKFDFHYVNPYESLKIKDIAIKAYGSTDKGVSFLVDVDEVTLFHAGDLNWWHWKKFSEEKRKIEEEDYKREVSKIIGEDIDIAFIPVDPRLDEFYYLGGEYFINTIKPKLLVPMHFRDNFYICDEFINKVSDKSTKIANINQLGQEISF
ncbi:putative Zn-dependent hydrolase [Gottschalkia purinilytica]|uniref:Putative Zn-dependent hydrolase n=1 Tax=Gottschalkia purinilytica TaxID=1503 RepID=A0A0L0W8C9_GOTPU|nr:MBL fold metallo-hydrolase [Gottschalkia purinilytica]KNF07706.1 putative Zn-dependent hydrolase [Gottschalkia purinilytica]